MKSNPKIYTSDSRLHKPYLFIKEIWNDLVYSRELAIRLCIRDIKAQYRQTFLGVFWLFIPPVAMAVGFSLASNAKVINFGTTEIPYVAYIIISMSLWQTFVESVEGPVKSFTNAKSMLVKINFPHEALILAKLGQVLFNFLIRLILIIGIFIWYGIQFKLTLFLAAFALINLVILGTFFGVLLTPLSALYHDFSKGLTIATGFWMIITPVVYPLPGSEGIFTMIVKLNPVTPLLVTTRELATTGQISYLNEFFLISLLAYIGLILGWLFYRLAIPFVIERISS